MNRCCSFFQLASATAATVLGFVLVLPVKAQPQSSADFSVGVRAFDSGDYAAALRVWLPLAKLGHPDAQHRVGRLYHHGYGLLPDPSTAAQWYRQAAEAGHAAAMTDLARMQLLGDGVRKDFKEALTWLNRAANQEYAPAQLVLGSAFANGVEGDDQRIAVNRLEAVKWFRRAASHGEPTAQKELGVAYYHGDGVLQDYDQAVRWFRAAADQGSAAAQRELGTCFLTAMASPKTIRRQFAGIAWQRSGRMQRPWNYWEKHMQPRRVSSRTTFRHICG